MATTMTLAELERLLTLPSAPDPTADILAGAPAPAPAPDPLFRPPGMGVNVGPAPIGPAYSGPVGQSAGSSLAPIADALASWGVSQQPGVLQSLALQAAPGVNWLERAARGIGRAGLEASGIPSAARAGEAAAEGNYVEAAGQGLMALPSRFASIPGAFLSEAGAQAPDPRLRRVQELQAEITRRETTLRRYGSRQFPSAKARADAVRLEEEGIRAARESITGIQAAMDAERQQAEAAERARLAGAQWAQTPFATKYPGAPSALAGIGAIASFALPYARSRGAVTGFNAEISDVARRLQEAIDRAKNTQLAPRTRTAAANEARALQVEFERIVGAGAQTGGHLRAFGEGAAPTELALALPSLIDYLSSTPGSELRRYTMSSINPLENPGEVLGRYGLGLGFGGALGEVGHTLGARGAQTPPSLAGEVSALNKRYTAPRRRRTP